MAALAPPTRDQFIEQHLVFARQLATTMKRRLPPCVDPEELESDAYLGLIEPARSFDPSRGNLFRALAATRIYGAMLDGIRQRNQVRRHHPLPRFHSLESGVDSGNGGTHVRLQESTRIIGIRVKADKTASFRREPAQIVFSGVSVKGFLGKHSWLREPPLRPRRRRDRSAQQKSRRLRLPALAFASL